MPGEGWFADLDEDEPPDSPARWRPYLQIAGCCLPLRAWFATEDDCLDFIRSSVVGQGLLDEHRGGS